MKDGQMYAKIHSAAMLDDSLSNELLLQIEIPRGMFDARIGGEPALKLLFRARESRTQFDLTRLVGMAVIVEQTSADSYRYVSLA